MVLDEHVLLRKKVSGPLLRPQLIACLFAEYDCPTAREDDVILAKEKAVTLDLVEPRPTAAARHANIAILAGRLLGYPLMELSVASPAVRGRTKS